VLQGSSKQSILLYPESKISLKVNQMGKHSVQYLVAHSHPSYRVRSIPFCCSSCIKVSSFSFLFRTLVFLYLTNSLHVL